MSEILKIQVEKCFFSVLLSALFEHPLKTFELAKHDRKKSESVSHSAMSDSLQPRGLYPTTLLCPWDFPGKTAGAGYHFLLRGSSRSRN